MNRRKEKIRKNRGQKAPDGLLTGRLHIARNGAGFVVDPVTDEAIWIEEPDLDTALPDDLVTVRRASVARRAGPHAGSRSARIVRIDERAARNIVGTVTGVGRFTRVQPLSPTFRQEFTVPARPDVHVNDRVVMRFVAWRNRHTAPEGEIAEVIGAADNPSLDTLAVMRQYDLPEEFPEAVVREAELVADLREGPREDLRKKFIFTCDPETARDYDDALSLEFDKAGNRVLGVHIADVSHYVRPGTALDREAYRRSTSVYLIGKVVPMLPEQLSNGVCSLVPNEDRLAFSAFLTFDASGVCVARRFAKTVIRSKARFTYEQVLAVLKGGKTPGGLVKPVQRKTILEIHRLAQQMRKRRFADGALDMEVPEAEILLDAQGMMTGVAVRPYDESHQLVEECMVAANEAVAKELWTNGVKILARLHEAPDPDRLEELRGNLAKLGISCGDLSCGKNMARFLKRLKGSPLESTVSVMVLRSLKRALYSPRAMGHFGLAKKFYAHFTSPIRRYPDLTLHRQLAAYVAHQNARRDMSALVQAGEHCSEREQMADEAERSLVEIKKFRYLEHFAEDPAAAPADGFEAVIARCTRYGCFVDLPALAVGGMIHISKLAEGYVTYDECSGELRAGARVWKTGDRLRVRVERVDFDRRLADFAPLERERASARNPDRRKRRMRRG